MRFLRSGLLIALLAPATASAQGLASAVKFFDQIPPESPYAVEGRFLVGMTRYEQGMERSAVIAFDEVLLATTTPRRVHTRCERRELGRVHDFAVAHLDSMRSGSPPATATLPPRPPASTAMQAVLRRDFDAEIRGSE